MAHSLKSQKPSFNINQLKSIRKQIYVFSAKENNLHSEQLQNAEIIVISNQHIQNIQSNIQNLIPEQWAPVIQIKQKNQGKKKLIIEVGKWKQQNFSNAGSSWDAHQLIEKISQKVSLQEINILLSSASQFNQNVLKQIENNKKGIKVNYLIRNQSLLIKSKNQTIKNNQYLLNNQALKQSGSFTIQSKQQHQNQYHQRPKFQYLDSKQLQSDIVAEEAFDQQFFQQNQTSQYHPENQSNLQNKFEVKMSQQRFSFQVRRRSMTNQQFKKARQKPRFTVIINSVSKGQSKI